MKVFHLGGHRAALRHDTQVLAGELVARLPEVRRLGYPDAFVRMVGVLSLLLRGRVPRAPDRRRADAAHQAALPPAVGDLAAFTYYRGAGRIGRIRLDSLQPRWSAPMTEAAILEGLSTSKLAVELNDEERRILAGAMTLRDLKHGEVLVQEGSADDHLYVVVSGVLGVVKGAGLEEEVTLNAIRRAAWWASCRSLTARALRVAGRTERHTRAGPEAAPTSRRCSRPSQGGLSRDARHRARGA